MARLDNLDYEVNGGTVNYEIVPEIAPLFNATTAYAAGDQVIHEGIRYKFTTAHPAGAWIGTDVEEMPTVAEELTSHGADITQLKADLSECEAALETKANIDGSYDDLTAGTAEQLLADTGMTDKSPYLFRAMPTGAGDREEPKIVGGSVVWNQLVTGSRETGTVNGITVTQKSDYSTELNGTVSNTTYVKISKNNNINWLENHKYFVGWGASFPTGCSLRFGSSFPENSIMTGKTATIAKASNTESGSLNCNLNQGMEFNLTYTLCVVDLTATFGTTIADYIYTLESATAGSGIAWLQKYGFFTSDYYPFCEPTFKHVEGLTAHKMVGFNQWDEKWEVGSIDLQTGQNTTSSAAIRSKNYIPVIPSQSYYVKKSGLNIGFRKYGANKEYLGYISANSSEAATDFGSDVHFIRFVTNSVTAYNPNNTPICVNLSDPVKNGTYEPYTAHTYPLDPDVVLRGIPKLDSANNLYFDGDVYKADGTVGRKYGVVDLGTLTWTYNSTTEGKEYFLASAPTGNDKPVGAALNAICNKYDVMEGASVSSNDKSIGINAVGQYIYVRDTSYTDAATFKAAMSGVYLLYPLATPTNEAAAPYAPLQLADPYGTEEWVLADGAFPMPVGQETFYPENLRAKIEGLPWNFANLIAPTETTNTATRNYTAGNLLIVDNILYKVTVNIANGGTITPGTNVTATTLAEIISALQ